MMMQSYIIICWMIADETDDERNGQQIGGARIGHISGADGRFDLRIWPRSTRIPNTMQTKVSCQ